MRPEVLDAARERAVVIMAYFAPDETLCAPLVRAAERGVDVQLLTIGKTDFPILRRVRALLVARGRGVAGGVDPAFAVAAGAVPCVDAGVKGVMCEALTREQPAP